MMITDYKETKNYLRSKEEVELKNLAASILTYSITHFRNIMLNEVRNKEINARIVAIHLDSLHNLPFILNGKKEDKDNWIFELTNSLEKFMKIPTNMSQKNKLKLIFDNALGFEDLPEKVKNELTSIEKYK